MGAVSRDGKNHNLSRCPGPHHGTSKTSGRPMGPATPAYTNQILPNKLSWFRMVVIGFTIGLWLLFWFFGKNTQNCLNLGLLSSGLCEGGSLVKNFGVPFGEGCVVSTTFLLKRVVRKTELRQELQLMLFYVLFCFVNDFFRTGRARAMLRFRLPTRLVQDVSPNILSDSFVGFGGLMALLFSSSSSSSSCGWVGFPCRVFFAFSVWFLFGWGCDSCFLVSSLASCIYSVGIGLNQHGVRARKPPGPPPRLYLARAPWPVSWWESTGGTSWVQTRWGDQGVCDPATSTYYDCERFFLAPRESAPPRLTLAISPTLGSIQGVVLLFCLAPYTLG